MSNFSNTNSKWTHTIDSAGTMTIGVGGKYVDKDIEISIPSASGSVDVDSGNGNVSGLNCTLSETDTSGISVSGKGAVSATAKVTTAGYTPINDSFAIGSSIEFNTQTKYITGVTLENGKSFSIDDGIATWTISKDANGNVSII